jgi:oligoendopeptidase F
MSVTAENIKLRADVAVDDQWNVSALYPSFDSWEKDLKEICKEPHFPYWPEIQIFRGRLKEGEEVLKEILDLTFDLSRRLEKLYTYAHLRHDEEITVDQCKGAFQRISSLLIDFQQECAWIDPEILSLPPDKIERYLSVPLLSEYRVHLEKIIRMRPFTLTTEKEELLAMAGKPMQTAPKAFSALNNADIQLGKVLDQTGKEHALTHGLFQLYLRSPDRKLRENAFKGLHEKYLGFENTLAELLHGEIQSHIFSAQARHFSSSLEAALFPKNIPLSVYRSLIETIKQGLPLLHRYISIRKKILKLEELHLYDMYVPLVAQVEIKMDYAQAEELVIQSTVSIYFK